MSSVPMTEPAGKRPDPQKPSSAWRLLSASAKGKRPTNDDFAQGRNFKPKASRRRYYSLVACDGVGSLPGSGQCAAAIGSASLTAPEIYLEKRKSRKPLADTEVGPLLEFLSQSFHEIQDKGEHSTTFVQLLFSAENALAIWAGDSRAYALSSGGELILLTRDHLDTEGRLLSYFTGNGELKGHLDHKLLPMKGIIALCVTTDGVHERCQPSELRMFLLYCMSQAHLDNQMLLDELEAFIGPKANDNFSMALAYRPRSPRTLYSLSRRTAAQLHQ